MQNDIEWHEGEILELSDFKGNLAMFKFHYNKVSDLLLSKMVN